MTLLKINSSLLLALSFSAREESQLDEAKIWQELWAQELLLALPEEVPLGELVW